MCVCVCVSCVCHVCECMFQISLKEITQTVILENCI